MRLSTAEEMMHSDQKMAEEYGMPTIILMEHAANCLFYEMKKRELLSGKIVIVCGKGNNGGDGFVVARKLSESGYNVCVIMASGYPTSPEATYMYKLVIDLSIPTVWYDADRLKAVQTIKNYLV